MSSYSDSPILKLERLSNVKPYPVKKHYVSSEDDGHQICVFEKGETTSKYSIILLHGRTWSSLPVFDLIFDSTPRSNRASEEINLSTMDMLVSNGVHVIAIDLRGFGGTSRDQSGWISPHRAVLDINSVVNWLGREKNISNPAILGWSQGGLIAQLYAQKYPDTISAIILYASIYDPKTIYQRNPLYGKAPTPLLKTNTMDQAIEDFTLPGSISDEAAYAFGESALTHNPVKVDWGNLHEFNEINPAKIVTPCLVVHGDNDPYLTKESQMYLFQAISSSDKMYSIIPGADHCAHLIGTRFLFIHHIVSFLKRPLENVFLQNQI